MSDPVMQHIAKQALLDAASALDAANAEIARLRAALAAAEAKGFAVGVEAAAGVSDRVAGMYWPPGQYQPSAAAEKCAAMIRSLRPPAAPAESANPLAELEILDPIGMGLARPPLSASEPSAAPAESAPSNPPNVRVRYIGGETLGGEPLGGWQQLGMKSTPEMRQRVRELATPPRDDFDIAVLHVLNDLEKRIAPPPAEPAGAPSEEVYERINMAEDLLGDALAYLEGEPISKDGVITNLHAYFEARKRR